MSAPQALFGLNLGDNLTVPRRVSRAVKGQVLVGELAHAPNITSQARRGSDS